MGGADLVLLDGSFPGAVFVDAHGRKVFDLPSNGVVGKSLKEKHSFGVVVDQLVLIMLITLSDLLTHPCFRMDVGSSKMSSLMQALHFWGPLLKRQHQESSDFNLKPLL